MIKCRSFFALFLALSCCSQFMLAQKGEAHLRAIAEEYCQGILSMPAVDTSSWWIETLDEELPSLTVSEAAGAAFLQAEGVELSEAMNTSPRLSRQLFGRVFSGCPTIAAKRFLLQQVAGGRYFDMLERPEWKEVSEFLSIDMITDFMVNEEELLVFQLNRAIKDSLHTAAFDTLVALTSSDEIYPLLFTVASAMEPKAMGRYQLEEYDGNQLSEWVVTNGPDSISTLIGMDQDYTEMCDRIERIVDSTGFDLAKMDQVLGANGLFDPRTESVDLLAEAYGAPVVNRAVLTSGATSVLFLRMFQECGSFRGLLKEHAFEAAMEAHDVTGAEKEVYQGLVNDLCGCLQFKKEAESKECFEKRMEKFGLTDENSNILEAPDDPELKRKMTIFTSLLPALGAGCAPDFEE